MFYNWTKIFIKYCDGALHQGYSKAPVKYKDSSLYFRGSNVTKSHIKLLVNNYAFDSAQKIVLSGSGSGGAAAFLWTNYIRSVVKNPTEVYTIIDSGAWVNIIS